jgi:hypothetical protein
MRVEKGGRALMLAKYVELSRTMEVTGTQLYNHFKYHAKGLLKPLPARNTFVQFVEKMLSIGSTQDPLKDLPRDQTNREGKTAPITLNQKRVIIQKAAAVTRPKHLRRATGLSQETHAGRTISKASIMKILRASGRGYRVPRSTIVLKEHHKQLRVRWAQKWGAKPPQFWQKFLFSDEKIFRMLPKAHRKNDGLWVSLVDPRTEDIDAITQVEDRHSSTVRTHKVLEGALQMIKSRYLPVSRAKVRI